nr:zinc finger protein 444 isoform X6 [Dasypus novemcinctus]
MGSEPEEKRLETALLGSEENWNMARECPATSAGFFLTLRSTLQGLCKSSLVQGVRRVQLILRCGENGWMETRAAEGDHWRIWAGVACRGSLLGWQYFCSCPGPATSPGRPAELRAPRDVTEGAGVSAGKEDGGLVPAGDPAPGTEVPAPGTAQAVRPYKQEPGSPPLAPGLPGFLVAPGAAACPECGKTALKPAHLLRHRQSHSGEKPHACPDCGKAFRRKEHLRRHRGTHPGGPGPALRPLPAREKPHACCECGKTFYWREHLVRHRKTHSGARPFACWECGKGFGRREHVLRHQRIHGRAAAGGGGTAGQGPEGGGPFPPWPLG